MKKVLICSVAALVLLLAGSTAFTGERARPGRPTEALRGRLERAFPRSRNNGKPNLKR